MNKFIENNPDKSIQFLTNNNLDDMIIEFIDNKYFPSVKIKNDMINSIHFRCNKNLYSIKNPDNCDNVDSINTIEEETLIEYDKNSARPSGMARRQQRRPYQPADAHPGEGNNAVGPAR